MSPHAGAKDGRSCARPAEKRGARPLLLAVVLLLVTGLALGPAYAATDPSDHSLHTGSPEVWISLVLVILGGLCLIGATRRGRNAAILSLALLVALFGLESTIHSVHHLSDPQAAASCALLSASQHVPGACAETADVGAPTWTAAPSPIVDAEAIRPLRAFRSHEGRAPPALPSV